MNTQKWRDGYKQSISDKYQKFSMKFYMQHTIFFKIYLVVILLNNIDKEANNKSS